MRQSSALYFLMACQFVLSFQTKQIYLASEFYHLGSNYVQGQGFEHCFLRDSASSFHWPSSSIFSYCSFVRLFDRPASVTSPLISTIWCFRAYKLYIFCEDMILATCQCQHVFCCWVEPSLLLSSSNFALYFHTLHKFPQWALTLDLFDPLKPFHRLTNGPWPSKTIETNGWTTPKPLKNHRCQWSAYQKTFNGDGVLQNHWKFSMVSSKPLKFSMVSSKSLEMSIVSSKSLKLSIFSTENWNCWW